jgi:hypothetical protein
MEETIKKMIEPLEDFIYEGICAEHENPVYHIGGLGIMQVSHDITHHVFEFVEWCIVDVYECKGVGYAIKGIDEPYLTMEQLYQYWLNNIHNER